MTGNAKSPRAHAAASASLLSDRIAHPMVPPAGQLGFVLPRDHSPLRLDGTVLRSPAGDAIPIVAGIPRFAASIELLGVRRGGR